MCNDCLDAGLSRRKILLSAAGLLAAAPLAGMAQAQPVAAADTPDAALNLLIEGNARYVANQTRERDFSVQLDVSRDGGVAHQTRQFPCRQMACEGSGEHCDQCH